jgi:hypothetical protein
MKIDLPKIPVWKPVKHYSNSDEEGVKGYGET